MEINIKSIPKSQHRYDTCGDYWYDSDGVLQFRVTEMDRVSMKLVLLHEIVEQLITEESGISEEEILEFDIAYEAKRIENESEPGDSPDCPYKDAHFFATLVEMMVANKLGIDWNQYNKNII